MSVLKEISSWSKSCPGWQRDALRRLVLNGNLSPDDIEELFLLCQSPHGSLPDGKTAPKEEALSEKHLPQDPAKNQSVTLASIKDVKNVNAIESKQPLAFADTGLTVLYGNNAVGKSGYARVLKSACRARSRPKRILSNVFKTTGNDPASATIEFKVGTKAKSHSWNDGDTALSPLALVSVFDSACALHYVGEANDVAFRPFGLDLLDKLASGCVQLKRRFDGERASLLTATKYFTDLSGQTDVGKIIQSLSAYTDPAVVEKLANLSTEETQRLAELKRHISQIEADDPMLRAKELISRAGRLDILAKRFIEIETALSDAKVGEIKEALLLSNSKSAAAKVASETAFKDEPLKNVGSETWKQLWETARRFSEKDAYPGIPFAVTSDGAVCVLCEQPLSADAVRRFSRFEEFVKAETQKAAQTAKERFDSLHEDFLKHTNDLTAPEDLLTQLELTHSNCATKIRSFLESCSNRRSDIVRGLSTNDWENIQRLNESPTQEIEKLVVELNAKSSEFERAKAPEKLAELRAERDQLLARSNLSQRKSDVLSEISRLKRLNVLSACLRDVDTTQISRKSTELTTSRVTKTICDSFRTELDGLGLSYLRVELAPIGSERGVMYHRVGLKGNKTASVQDVASEGEHRSIALAAFLAELATASHKSALVFDDPVSSLDHRWRESVARRLGKIIGVKSKHLTFGLRHNGPEINTDEDGIMPGNGAADYVESQVLQLFEADATLESPAVCSAI